MLAAEGGEFDGIAGNQRVGHELRIIQYKEFFRRVADFFGIVHHQGLRVNRLQHVGGGDVAHVEGRVLAHQQHVRGPKIGAAFLSTREMISDFVAHRHIIAICKQRTAAQRQGFGLVIEQRMAAGLSFQHHGES